jgi:hypothetical protein
MRSFFASGFAVVAGLITAVNGYAVNGGTNTTINSQVRLAYAGSTGMYVSWNTFSHLDNPTVKYGLTPAMDQSASSNVSVTYPTSLTYNNHVKITGLLPDTLYYYLPMSMLTDSTTNPPYTFRTARLPGDAAEYSVAVVVDLGTMGPQGLTPSAGKGVAKTNILAPGDNNTIQSLAAVNSQYDFLWHREFLVFDEMKDMD